MKPHIELGSGIKGNLTVDYALLDKIRERAEKIRSGR